MLQSAGLLFFAFAGYARIATMGEEVRDPARTIPRAIQIALALAVAVYAVIAVTILQRPRVRRRWQPRRAPLAAAVEASGWRLGRHPSSGSAVRRVALGALLALVAGRAPASRWPAVGALAERAREHQQPVGRRPVRRPAAVTSAARPPAGVSR